MNVALPHEWSYPQGMSSPWSEALKSKLSQEQVDLFSVLAEVVGRLRTMLDADRVTVYLVDPSDHSLVSRIAYLPEIPEIRLKLGEGVAGWVAEHRQMVNLPRGRHDHRFSDRTDVATGYITKTILATPIVGSDGSLLGVLQALNKHRGLFDAEDEDAINEVAREVSELIDASSLAGQLRPGPALPLAFRFNHIVGNSEPMQEVFEHITRAAATDATVLLRGERGTGKEVFARAIHFNSPRRDRPLVKVDCAAIPADLIENELFGHEKGAFTGADRRQDGKIAAAAGGTLFLDEIGELPIAVQGTLLRLFQDRTYFRVGGNTPETIDVRFVCATHRPLEKEIAAGRFRQDLYYRMRVVEMVLPPLRERGRADLDRLIDHFLYVYGRRHRGGLMQLSADARQALHRHRWTGNVRELECCVESAVVLSPTTVIEEKWLQFGPDPADVVADGDFRAGMLPLEEVERRYVEWAVGQCDGNRSQAARMLGIGRNTLATKLKE